MSSYETSSEKRTDSEQSTNNNNTESDWYDLTAFQRDILRFLAEMEAEDAKMYGMGLKRRLEGRHGEINHGRLYPNLDDLVDAGLIEKGRLDKRTNSYTLRESGRHLLREQRRAWAGLELPSVAMADGGAE